MFDQSRLQAAARREPRCSPSAAHISSGLLPSEYIIDRKPLWKELRNI